MKKIAIITARSGSKGLPNKNVLMLGSKPLMAYSILAAIESKAFERVIVSTDSLEYKSIAEKYGAEVFMRGAEISDDTTSSFVVIEDVLKRVKEKYDYFVLLQPTSPFRTAQHIRENINLFEKHFDSFDFSVSMVKSGKSSRLIVNIGDDNSLKEFTLDFSNYARQKYNEYTPNGAIFIAKIDKYLERKHFYGEKSLAYYMNKEDSIDIDDKLDFEMAISVLNRRNNKKNLFQNIRNRIKEKEHLFSVEKDITLIGHSILDNWDIQNFKGYSINNLGIRGISTREYKKLIFDENKIKNISDKVFLMLGTNDIVDRDCTFEDILNDIEGMIKMLKNFNPRIKIYFLEILSVSFRMDRKKENIFKLNEHLKKKLSLIEFIEVNKYMIDKFGNLNLDYTDDGLHLNDEGYKRFQYALEEEIKI